MFWDVINSQLNEDRVLGEDDLGSEEVAFATGSSEDLELLIQLILYSFPEIWGDDLDEIDVTILSSTESEPASVDHYCSLMEDGEISEDDKQSIRSLIECALERNQPTGYHLEYNDGLSGRASGYYESQNSISYTVARPTYHELAVAQDQLLAAFGEGAAEEITKYLPKESDDHGQRAIS